ncbi:hypothetical protein TSL1_09490 [Sulfurovum sp. TSL1]|nr:hypothetical protein TSL1_09490 [Sulfurovum sp. TSL1]
MRLKDEKLRYEIEKRARSCIIETFSEMIPGERLEKVFRV